MVRSLCGIAGIVQLSNSEVNPINEAVLGKMADLIAHRGPDEDGFYVNAGIGLAHRRLSIIDLKTGQQPMHSQNGQVSLVFNGEIYNYIELREELKRRGCSFQTTSDTEVLIHMYLAYGEKFVDHLNGQFAIAIWDNRNKKMLLVRDRVGICPLYYTEDNGTLVFASEIKALKPALTSGLELNKEALDQIFTFWAPVAPNTVFEGVFELPPGKILTIEHGQLSISTYWDWTFNQGEYWCTSEDDMAEELHNLLIDATTLRLRSDVPVGAYLSGGLDSSVLVALIHHYGNVPLRTFSLNFDEKDYDEKKYQVDLIKQLDTTHSSLLVSKDDISRNFVDTIYHTEAPILRTAPVPMGLLSGLVRQKGYKVVLTGEGADEVLGGYDIFKESKVRQFWARNVDSSFRPLLLKKLYPYLNLPKSNQATYLKQFFGAGLESPDNNTFSHLPRWASTAKAKLFYSDSLKEELRGCSMKIMEQSLPENLTQMHPFNKAQYIEAKSLMAGYLLTSQGDRMLAKNSVEGRFPFLDHRVIEFANRIPPKYKMKVLNEKYLLKKSMAKYLPDSVTNRHKQPYRAPDAQAMSGKNMGDELRSYVTEEQLKKTSLFDVKKVGFLMKKADSGKPLSVSESQALVGILSTQVVVDKFVSQ